MDTNTIPLANNNADTKEASRISYPNFTLSASLPFVEKIYTELGSNQYHDKELIAKIHGLAYASIKSKLSTAQQYGLLQIKHGVGYKVTHLFIKLHKPLDDAEKKNAVLTALNSSELYQRLFNQYKDNRIPSVEVLSTVLFRNYGFIDRVSRRIAEIFITNLSDYGLLNAERIIQVHLIENNQDNQEENLEIVDEQAITNIENVQKALPAPVTTNAEILSTEIIEIPIPLKGSRRAFLRIPENFQPEDLDRISKFVDALK